MTNAPRSAMVWASEKAAIVSAIATAESAISMDLILMGRVGT
jgi:hypothetical protein